MVLKAYPTFKEDFLARLELAYNLGQVDEVSVQATEQLQEQQKQKQHYQQQQQQQQQQQIMNSNKSNIINNKSSNNITRNNNIHLTKTATTSTKPKVNIDKEKKY